MGSEEAFGSGVLSHDGIAEADDIKGVSHVKTQEFFLMESGAASGVGG
jgi:hypothetical protein